MMKAKQNLTIGQWVEVCSKEEILRTLDQNGQLGGMPFMPEMFQFCGRRFQVYKIAHKTCDPDFRSRRIPHAVHLETRCDGQAHGGCQAGCLLFWKEAWLRPVGGENRREAALHDESPSGDSRSALASGCAESAVWNGVRAQTSGEQGEDTTYVCQTTQVQFAEPLKWWTAVSMRKIICRECEPLAFCQRICLFNVFQPQPSGYRSGLCDEMVL